MQNLSYYADVQTINRANWSSTIQDQMYQMYLDEQMLDVFLTTADGVRLGAHKTILGASSAYFFQAFTDVPAASTQSPTELQLIDIDGNVLKLLVTFCYTGGLDLSFETIRNVIKVATELKFHAIIELCCEFFMKRLDCENCCFIELIADQLQLVPLANVAHRFALDHFERVSESHGFVTVPTDKLRSYLDSDYLNVRSEQDVFQAFIRWTLHNTFVRLSYVPQLLPMIRLTQLEDTFLFDEVQNFAVGNNCSQLVIDALNWKFIPSRRHQINAKFKTQARNFKMSLVALAGTENDTDNEMLVEQYSVATNEWKRVQCDVQFPKGCAIVELTGELIVLGGWLQKNASAANVFSIGGESGLLQSQMTVLPNMLTARSDHSAVVWNGCIYVAGGRNGSMALRSMERYDPATQKWDYLSPMTNARFDFNLAVLNGRLYAAGGTTTDTNQPNESFDSVECYNPTIDQWTHVSSMTRRRCQASFAVSDDRLYIFGGYDNDLTVNSAIDTVECYNPIDNTWTAVAPLSSPRYGFCALAINDYIVVVGGMETLQTRIPIVEKYDIHTDTWSPLAQLNSPRSCHHLCMMKNNVIAFN